MIKKLEDILAKYRALSEQMADPAVIADPRKMDEVRKKSIPTVPNPPKSISNTKRWKRKWRTLSPRRKRKPTPK